MKVILAQAAGACFGVNRALKIAHDAIAESEHIATLGPLIHNPQVVSELESEGAVVIRSIEEGGPYSKVVIRSHGVTPQVMDRARELGLDVLDATCPHVLHAQRTAQKLGTECATVVVVGEPDHPEVESLNAYASLGDARVVVTRDPDAVPGDIVAPVGVVVQTTQTPETLQAVCDRIRAQGIEPLVKDTTCQATSERQGAAAELAKQVDAMVVIGGRISSNTTRLAEVCSQHCPKVFHVEATDKLDPEWFAGCASIGVTAGASTPEDQIAAVMAVLESF